MSPEQDNFRQLRRLLTLKRHEQPPPGYFKDFSRQVVAQIVAGRPLDKDPISEQLLWEAPWLQRLWALFEAKPMLAGAFGVAVCGLLVSGITYSERSGGGPVVNLPQMPEPSTDPVKVAGNSPVDSLVGNAPAMNVSSTAGFVTQPSQLSLFQEAKDIQSRDLQKPWVVSPASYKAGN